MYLQIRFEEIRKEVLENGSFFIASKLFMIRSWSLSIEQDIRELKTISVWVIFRDYPIEFWDKKWFSKIASAIDIHLFTDRLTNTEERTSFARVCVEVNTKCDFPDSITKRLTNQRQFFSCQNTNGSPPMLPLRWLWIYHIDMSLATYQTNSEGGIARDSKSGFTIYNMGE